MEWDQKIFRLLWHASRRAFRRSSPVPRARLNQQNARWTLLAGMLATRSIHIVEDEGAAAVEKIAGRFFLPLTQALFGEEDEDEDFLRCCMLVLSEALIADQSNLNPLQRWRAIFAEYPGARELYRRVVTAIHRSEAEDARLATGCRRRLRVHLCASVRPSMRSVVAGAPADMDVFSDIERLRAKPTRDESGADRRIELPVQQELLRVDRKQIEDYTLGHNFEKIETADEFDGRWRDLENDEDPDETAEALEEVKLGYRIRTADAPGAIRSADVGSADAPDAAGADSTEHAGVSVFFDEWDDRRRQYRRNHCRVFIREFRDRQSGFANRVLAVERRTFLRIDRRMQECFQELETVRRQTSGDEPDYEAVVAALADLRAGRTPDERLYMGRRKRRKNITLHFLLDLSLSTDAFVAGRRVLDVERAALTVFGEVLERHHCRFAVSAFYSHTRNDCVYLNVKNASASWAATRDRLGALAPRGYTRIGPALRRTIQELSGVSGARWIVLFTDGRPNDYDRYEGQYGIRDVRQAVREAEAAGVQLQTFAINAAPALDTGALGEMFGRNRYRVLREPSDLAGALGEFFLRLIR